MFGSRERFNIGGVLILIHLDRSEPPAGTIALPRDPGQPTDKGAVMEFTGWLGMLHALQEVLESRPRMD
jgi:hypothetical protein